MKKHLLLLTCIMIAFLLSGTTAAALSLSFDTAEYKLDFGTSSDGAAIGNIEDVLLNNADSLLGSIYSGVAAITLQRVSQQTFTGSGVQADLLAEYAGYAAGNVLGWYDVANSDNATPIFTGSDASGASYDKDFVGPVTFGFYLDPNGDSTNRMYSGMTPDQAVIYKVLEFDNEYIVGFEDLLLQGSDRDYQDLIARAQVAPVPEPGTIILLGTGLIGLAGLGRKKFKR